MTVDFRNPIGYNDDNNWYARKERKMKMKNWEKYEKEVLEIVNGGSNVAVYNGKPEECNACNSCDECRFGHGTFECQRKLVEWLYEEYAETVELSRFEYEVLKFLKAKGYKYLARDKDHIMCMYPQKPRKDERKSEWYVAGVAIGVCDAGVLNNIFEWVAWSNPEPTSIEFVLNNCTIKEEK